MDATDHDVEAKGIGRRSLVAGASAALAAGVAAGATGGARPAAADVPNGSVTPASFAPSAIDPAADVPGARTLGSGPRQAASGAAVDAALGDVGQLVAGTGIELTNPGNPNQWELSATNAIDMPLGRVEATDFFGAPILQMRYANPGTETLSTTPDIQMFGNSVGTALQLGGPTIVFGVGGDAAPDTRLVRTGPGVLEINGERVATQQRLGATATGLPTVSGTTAVTAVTTVSVPAGRLAEGDALTVIGAGTVANGTGAATTVRLIVAVNDSELLAGTVTVAAGANPAHWRLTVDSVMGDGANSQSSTLELRVTVGTTATIGNVSGNVVGSAATTLPMGAAHTVALKVAHASASSLVVTTTRLASVSHVR